MRCVKCARSRTKSGNPEWVECKIKDASAEKIMAGYVEFIDKNGKTETPFVVETDLALDAEHAWPFQFDPRIILKCEGFVEKTNPC